MAEAIKGAAESAKEYVAGAVEMAAHTERLQIGTQVLAKARGLEAKAARDQIEAIKQIGYTTENATEIINRMLVAGQNLQRSQALAKVVKDLYAAGIGTSPAETVEKMLLPIETGESRGLRPLGLWVDLTTKQEIAALKAGRALSEEEKSTVAYNAIMQKASVALGTTAAPPITPKRSSTTSASRCMT